MIIFIVCFYEVLEGIRWKWFKGKMSIEYKNIESSSVMGR